MSRHEAWQGVGELRFDPQPPPAVAYEPKTCEMCPRTFLRQVGSRVKYCAACLSLAKMAPPALSAMNPARERRSGYHRRVDPDHASVADAAAAIQQIQRSAGVKLEPWQRQIIVESYRRKMVH